MSRLTRRSLVASAVLLAAVAGTCWSRQPWARQWGLDLWELPGQQKLLGQEQQRERELEVSHARIMHRIAIKQRIAADLIAGRLTLAQAALRFRPLLLAAPAVFAQLRENYPGADEDECACRNVLLYAQAALLTAQAPRREEVLRRLERELCEHLARQAGWAE